MTLLNTPKTNKRVGKAKNELSYSPGGEAADRSFTRSDSMPPRRYA